MYVPATPSGSHSKNDFCVVSIRFGYVSRMIAIRAPGHACAYSQVFITPAVVLPQPRGPKNAVANVESSMNFFAIGAGWYWISSLTDAPVFSTFAPIIEVQTPRGR